MKKLLYCAAALVMAFFSASCQQENLEPVGNGGAVTFTVTTPGDLDTRAAIADGKNVNELHWAVYKTKSGEDYAIDGSGKIDGPLAQGTVVMSNKTASVELDLLQDQYYTILFWAQVAGARHYTVGDLREVKVNGTTIAGNDESRAAFYQIHEFDTKEQKNYEVTLVRPFAQINLGTTIASLTPLQEGQDKGYTIDVKESKMIVKKIASSFNLVSGMAGNENVDFTFTSKRTPAKAGEKLTVNNVDYHYVAMNYLLVPNQEKLVEVSYEITTDKGKIDNTIKNVPVKGNYRTNIIGNLLTSKTEFDIIVDENFETPDLGTDYVWGGEVKAVTPVVEEDGKTVYYINDPSQLAWVAQQVNSGQNSFNGKYVRLTADLDLANRSWVPIGISWENAFQGTFEGVAISTRSEVIYPTISNVNVSGDANVGFFGFAKYGAIQNFNLKNVKVTGSDYVGAVVGNTISPVSNVHVTNAELTAVPYLLADGKTYDGGAKVGGIAGLLNDSNSPKMIGNSVTDVTIKGYRDLGGIVGSLSSKACHIENCSVENITFVVTSDYVPYEGGKASGNYDSIVGGTRHYADDYKEGNYVGDVVVSNHVSASNESTLLEVLKQQNPVVSIPAGTEIELPAGLNPAGYTDGTVTIVGAGESSVVKGIVGGGNNPGNYANNLHLVFKDITYVTANSGYSGGFGHAASVTFINCKIVGSMYAHSNAPHYFYDCTIDPLNGYLYTYASDCVFEGCTFEASEGKALQIYEDGTTGENTVTIKNCDFVAAKTATTWDEKPVTGIDINSIGATFNVTIDDCTTSCFPAGLNSGSDLYNIKGGADYVNLVIDGVCVNRAGYTQLAGYPDLWTKDGEYFVFDLAGLKDLHKYFAANSSANSVWGKTYNIGADIDAAGYTWEGLWMNVGYNKNDGIVLDGNNHTISNLTIKDYMFASTPTGGDEGVKPGEVKNITMKTPVVNGSSHDATVFWGNCYTNVDFTNVIVDGAVINGGSNVGAFLSRTTIENPNAKIDVNFTNCKVINSTLKADDPNADPTGASAFIGRAYGNTTIKFSGCEVENNTIINENGLVGGQVYGYATVVDGNWVGIGAYDTFTDFAGVEVVMVGSEVYGNFADAVAAAKEGDTISLVTDVTLSEELEMPAGVTLNGNGKQINGSIYAGGDLAFDGHTKVTAFSAGYYNHIITINKDACLEVTGSGRVSFAYGNTFNITGNLTDANTADMATVQPSMIIPGGISITGSNDAVMNITDAYVRIGPTSSKNKAANGKFTLNIENSIAEFTKELAFYEPTSGMNPTFEINIINSVMTTGAKFQVWPENSTVIVDNSSIEVGHFMNRGDFTLRNNSVMNGTTIQYDESGGGNSGTITVDNSKFTISSGQSKAHAYDGKGTGKIVAKNGAEVSVEYYKNMEIDVDTTSTFNGTKVN